MFFENQANEQKRLDNQSRLNIRFSTSSASNHQNEIIYSKILHNDRQPFWVDSTPRKHLCKKIQIILDLYVVFGWPE